MAKCGNQVKWTVTAPPAMKEALDKEAVRSGQKSVEIVRRAIAAELQRRGAVLGSKQ